MEGVVVAVGGDMVVVGGGRGEVKKVVAVLGWLKNGDEMMVVVIVYE